MSRAGISVSLGLLSAIIVGILPQSAISFKQLAKQFLVQHWVIP